MINRFAAKTANILLTAPKYNYHFPPRHSNITEAPGLTAKRVIKCISERLKKYDPEKWEGVQFSFNTNWRDEGGYSDVDTCIHASEALEKQFGIDVKDRHILISDIQTAFSVVCLSHDAI